MKSILKRSKFNFKKDIFLWSLIIIVSLFIGFFYYRIFFTFFIFKFFFLLFFFILIFCLFIYTTLGKKLKLYFNESLLELYKISWASRKEVLYLTLYVFVMVFIVSVLIWLIDIFLFNVIGKIVGYV